MHDRLKGLTCLVGEMLHRFQPKDSMKHACWMFLTNGNEHVQNIT